MKKADVFLADGFEEIEGLTVVDVLRRAGVEVNTVSVMGRKQIHGAHNILVDADVLFEDISAESADMLVLPGGMPGTLNLKAHEGLRSLLKTYDEVVFIPMSSGLSNTCQTAALLAEDEPYAGRVFVVDNHRISVTQSMSVLDAVTLAGQGRSGAEIKEILEREALDATIYIAVDTLEYLKKGGRITPAAAALGTILKLKPVLTIQGDKLDSYAKARGMKSAFRTMLDALDADIAGRLSHLRESGRLKIGIANTHMDADKLENYKNELQKAFPDLELIYFPLTMSIGTHVGPGGLGIGAVISH